LADGRLDEAFEIAQGEEVRSHRHGQRLIGRLARAIVRRGQEHLASNRFQPALLDCNKAEKLAGAAPEVAQLRAAICDAMMKSQQDHQQEALRVAQAKRHIEDGWLSVGGRILDEADRRDGQAELVRQELAAARLQTEDAVVKAELALQRGDLEEAIGIVRATALGQSKNGRAGELLGRIKTRVVERVRSDLEQGRIDRAHAFLQQAMPFGKDGTELAELTETLARCRQAAQHVAAGRPGAALPLLRKVKVVCPSARWLDSAISDIKRAAEAYEELDAGPLGLTLADATTMMDEVKPDADAAGAPGKNRAQGVAMQERAVPAGGESLPSRFIMQIDGVGSFLVFREPRVTLGPISSSARPMLGLMTDPNSPVILIERVDGDYFVRAQAPIDVNGKSVGEAMLRDGDRITLSSRCILRFHLPNPASTTALLTISGARLSRPDIRQVVLMDRDILVGPYTNNHIRTDQLKDAMTLFAQNGRLLCRTQDSIVVDGRSFDPNVGLAVDKRVEIGKLSMVVARLGEGTPKRI
jgi:tetratricopeptide (TPR) repeat protein